MTAPVGPFFVRGVTRFIACPAVANLAAPTRAELNAGTPLTNIVGIGGFSLTRSFLPTPDLDSVFTGNVAGELSAGDCSLTFKDVRGDTSNRDVLAEGTSLVLVKMDYGDYPDARCECWPVISGGVNQQVDLSAYGQFKVDFSVPEPPEKNAVIPSAAAPDTTAPTTPSGLTATAGSLQIRYAWTASTDAVGVSGYRIRRGGSLIATITATEYVLTGLTAGTAVNNVTVASYDAAGNESAQATFPAATPTA